MTRPLPALLPTEADHAAEEAALAAEDAAALAAEPRTPAPLVGARVRVARVLASLGVNPDLAAPPREAASARPVAASLRAWADDPVVTLPPLRLADGADAGDLTRSGTFAASALARAVAPDLAALGWRIAAGSLVDPSGARASEDDAAEAVVALVREAVDDVVALDAVTEAASLGPVMRLGAPRFRPSARYAEHLDRLAAHAERASADADRLRTLAAERRALAALHRLNAARVVVRRPGHDDTPARYTFRLLASLGDLASPRARRALVTSLRSALPVAEPASVDGLAAARGWLASLSGVIPRSPLFGAYVDAGAPGNLDKRALLALAADVLGEPRKRRGAFVYVVEGAA